MMIPVLGLLGLIGAAAYSWTIPDTFVSTSVIGIGDGYIVGVNSEDERDLGIPSQWWFTSSEEMARYKQIRSRPSLQRVIHQAGLYEDELVRVPMEDLLEQMQTSEIRINPVTGSRRRFALSVAGRKALRAQAAAWNMVAELVDGSPFSILESPSLPVQPEDQKRWRVTGMGLVGGVLAGALAALFTKLKVWKLAMALGIAAAAATFIVSEQYTSMALVRYSGPDGWSGMRELIEEVTSDPSLDSIVTNFGVYPHNQRAATRLREHLRIQPTQEPDAKAVVISFVDSRPQMAQKVVADTVSRLIDNSLKKGSGVKVDLYDAPILPVDPSFPNRPIAAAAGFSLGLAGAIALGIWRQWKGKLPWKDHS